MLIFLVLPWCCCVVVCAQGADSVSSKRGLSDLSLLNWPVIGVPTVAYSPETSWSFGLAGVWFFDFPDASRNSELNVQGAYTLENQYNFQAQATLYFGRGSHWMFSGAAGYKYYPNTFYGIGNRRSDLLERPCRYSSNVFNLTAQPLYGFDNGWMLGPAVQVRYEAPIANAVLDSASSYYGITGNVPYWMVGLGGVVWYDSRDHIYYPQQGLFFKGRVYYYEPYLGSSYRVGWCDLDFRQFVPLGKGFVFGWQALAQLSLGNNLPFEMMPTLGGEDMGRGIRRGVWCDDVMLGVQGEFRLPIWRYFKAVVFGSVGDVYGWDDWRFSVPKVGYGVGLRITVLKPSVNVRFDVARNNYNNDWSFYFTVKEAF